jgi:hypothetical protein
LEPQGDISNIALLSIALLSIALLSIALLIVSNRLGLARAIVLEIRQ